MADSTADPNEIGGDAPPKKSKLPLILGVVFAILGAGGGFMAVQMGLIGGSSETSEEVVVEEAEPLPELAFVPLEPIVVNLPRNAQAKHLLFTAQLEVDPAYVADVQELVPRVVDVLNGYLRSVEISQLEDPTALIRLRAQMLRRVQVVVGDGRVKDILIMEFVLN